jgi:hypothetical protein
MKKFWLSLGLTLILVGWGGGGYYGFVTSPSFGQDYNYCDPNDPNCYNNYYSAPYADPLSQFLYYVGAIAAMSAGAQAQYGYNYPPPPADPYSQPWVGPNTPWVYYNGDWFLNGILQYFFGPQYGWAPYYAYPFTYVVRPYNWYEPKWLTWYQRNPHYWENFQRAYPYWRGHREGQRYEQSFYEMHHRGQGAGWQKGFQGRAIERPQPEVRRPGPAQVAPHELQRPGPTRVAPPPGRRAGPARVAPPEGRRPGPAPAGGKKAPAGKPEKTGPGEVKY